MQLKGKGNINQKYRDCQELYFYSNVVLVEITFFFYYIVTYAWVPLGIFASAMVKRIIIHAMLPDALRF